MPVLFSSTSKGFDKVWYRGLLLKLKAYGISGQLFTWFKNYLGNREQRMVNKTTLSSAGKIRAGVPQGSVLGPLLFLVYTNDISDYLVSLCRSFADDTSFE